MSAPPRPVEAPPALPGIPSLAIAQAAALLPVRRFGKGATIFQENAPCEGFWIVRAGSVNLAKYAADGRVRILETCGRGDLIALVSAVDGGGYPATAIAREDSLLSLFPRARLTALISSEPDVGFAVARTLATRLRGLTGEVAAVSLQDVRGRLAAYLLCEADAHGYTRPDGSTEIRLPGVQEEIAGRIGTVREVLARTLRALERQNLISRTRESVVIRDMGGLRAAAAV